jgi:hypothetical protein
MEVRKRVQFFEIGCEDLLAFTNDVTGLFERGLDSRKVETHGRLLLTKWGSGRTSPLTH